jgi:hypothetical protein
MTHQAAAAGVPALGGWRTVTIALGCALVIGGIGGLIGLGGGEFRLPLLVGLIGFTARAAVPMNQILSLITLVTALIVRWHTGSLVGVVEIAGPQGLQFGARWHDPLRERAARSLPRATATTRMFRHPCRNLLHSSTSQGSLSPLLPSTGRFQHDQRHSTGL